LLLYSSDISPTPSANNLISIQLDSITLNKIIADSEALGKVVKKINFRDENGFTKLVVEGKSSKFSFYANEERSICDASCDVRCKSIPKPTIPPPKPFIEKKDNARGPPYLPPVIDRKPAIIDKKDDGIEVQRTTQSTTQRIVPTTTQRTTIPSTQRITTTRTPTTTTQRQTRPTVSVTRRTSTPGPAYLPLAKISTQKRLTMTEKSYPPATWPSTTRIYTSTFPTWSAPIRRSTEVSRFVTSTAKYLYSEPSNSLIYAGESE
jgi:hypothetical protein